MDLDNLLSQAQTSQMTDLTTNGTNLIQYDDDLNQSLQNIDFS